VTSPDDTVIFPNSGMIMDNAGNAWDIDSQARIEMNGNVDPNTANVTEMAFVNGVVWQENASNLWWSWNPNSPDNYNGWSPSSGTSTSPLPTSSPMMWVGGGSNNANDPSQWSANRVPQPGDTLTMLDNRTMNISGNDLQGDPLQIGTSSLVGPFDAHLNLSNADANIQTLGQSFDVQSTGNANVELGGGNGVGLHGTVSLDFNSRLLLQGSPSFIYGLTVNGPAQASILDNEGHVTLTNATFTANMTGNGTFNLERFHDGPGTVNLFDKVGSNLTFNMEGEKGGFQSTLVVGEYPYFEGQVNVLATSPAGSPGADVLDFRNLTATSYDIKPDLLTLYNGDKAVDTVRLNSALPFQVTQHGSDVAVYFGDSQPLGSDTILPVHT